ncbi:hypothetical protein VHUM_03998 [Vanrija humicola]|uniref:Glutamyl-tRNA(Gln) amidotransferase subunit F, mitochondrial n=1 Tax=Vanrija humicola TaxID=5417 RepID=A0A7D8UWG6_VANHU|nr:hypothetical protein VHUM_03998 [Vanrija humicola]
MRLATTSLRVLKASRPAAYLVRPFSVSACTTFDPLAPSVDVTALGLPTRPQPAPIPSIPRAPPSPELLAKLHTLSALDPPAAGSSAEAALIDDLGELLGLMDLVKTVELPQDDVASLLTEGVGEVVFDGRPHARSVREGEAGRELLSHATRRVGDYYGFKTKEAK